MRLLLMAGMLALIGCRTPAPRTPERPGLFAAVSEHWGAQPVSRCVYRSGVALTAQ